MFSLLILPIFIQCGPVDWLSTDLNIAESGNQYVERQSAPRYQVGLGVDFPVPVQVYLEAVNNVAIEQHEGRIYLAVRTSKNHFASNKTELIITSADLSDSGSDGLTFKWEHELTISTGVDMREPYFLSLNDRLVFYFFKAGTDPSAFEPDYIHRVEKVNDKWTEPIQVGGPGEVRWQVNYQNGRYHASSYFGNGYTVELGGYHLRFNTSVDGLNWTAANEDKPIVYEGGISEVGWTFDLDGNVWGVGRNEHGDESGWGSRTFFAKSNDLSNWQFISNQSDPYIYESPKLFRHGKDIYLVARNDLDGTFKSDPLVPFHNETRHHAFDLAHYSLRRHGTSLWILNQSDGSTYHVYDLPGCGDNAFPSILRLSAHKYILANYTSPTSRCEEWSWLRGQMSPRGTGVYFVMLDFEQYQ